MRVKPSRDTAQPIKSGKHCDSTECRQMREFAASNTWKDDRKIAIHVENKRRDTDDCAGERWETGEWDGERDENKEQNWRSGI